jgi:hypothetical protein
MRRFEHKREGELRSPMGGHSLSLFGAFDFGLIIEISAEVHNFRVD